MKIYLQGCIIRLFVTCGVRSAENFKCDSITAIPTNERRRFMHLMFRIRRQGHYRRVYFSVLYTYRTFPTAVVVHVRSDCGDYIIK
jgi:hypothetical protein